MMNNYLVEGTDEKEIHNPAIGRRTAESNDLVRKGKVAAYRRTHAQILLFTDEG